MLKEEGSADALACCQLFARAQLRRPRIIRLLTRIVAFKVPAKDCPMGIVLMLPWAVIFICSTKGLIHIV